MLNLIYRFCPRRLLEKISYSVFSNPNSQNTFLQLLSQKTGKQNTENNEKNRYCAQRGWSLGFIRTEKYDQVVWLECKNLRRHIRFICHIISWYKFRTVISLQFTSKLHFLSYLMIGMGIRSLEVNLQNIFMNIQKHFHENTYGRV